MTWKFEIEHLRGISCDLGNINGLLLKLGGDDERLGKGGHMTKL